MLEGAQFNAQSGCVELSEQLHYPLPPCYLRWTLKSQGNSSVGGDGGSSSGGDGVPKRLVAFPLYLTSQRGALVSEVLLTVPAALPAHVWAQRGVALIFQSSSV